MDSLIEYMKKFKSNIEKELLELQEQMEQLDENSKDYVELDFEYNWLSGQMIAVSHLLQQADKMKGE